MKTSIHTTDTTELHRLARRRAGAKLGWLMHALIYILFNGGMVLLSALALYNTRHGALATALAWGLGLLIHGLVVFGAGPGSRLREWLVQAEVKNLQGQRDPW
ncbi:MAG: 2TM domain-containing protein [Pseudomonadota bacterium]